MEKNETWKTFYAQNSVNFANYKCVFCSFSHTVPKVNGCATVGCICYCTIIFGLIDVFAPIYLCSSHFIFCSYSIRFDVQVEPFALSNINESNVHNISFRFISFVEKTTKNSLQSQNALRSFFCGNLVSKQAK